MTSKPIPYRRTLLLDDTGDLQFDGAGKMIMTTTDDQKRQQDLYIYLKTLFGEDIFNSDYGFDLMAAKENPFSKPRIGYEIKETIEQYRNRADRPNRIKNINYIDVGDPDSDRVVEISVSLIADTNTINVLAVNV